MTSPVSASNCEPWHGHWSFAPEGTTVQPICVHLALKHTALPRTGWPTMTGLPSADLADTAPPTGTASSSTKAVCPLIVGAVPCVEEALGVVEEEVSAPAAGSGPGSAQPPDAPTAIADS